MKCFHRPSTFIILSTCLTSCHSIGAAELVALTSPAAAVDYLNQVKPLLATRCFACHGALKQAAGLRLDTVVAIRKGGDSGSAVELQDVDASILLERVTTKDIDERMPPEGEGSPLQPDEVALLRSWIAAGAEGPNDEKPESDPREHWAFRPPQRPPVPQVRNAAWVRNPIDAFLAAEHERHGLAPQAEADPGLLLRRLYLDLIGLPPTREQLNAFVVCNKAATGGRGPEADRDHRSRLYDDAFESLVDQLLASPQYGERWGRHWMDIWRYSDWWGLNADIRSSQKHIWHWRDWIVESLNADVGYDEMIRQMLAADELYPDDLDKLRATGFLVRGYFKFNRNTWLEGVVEHTSKGFLGLTLNCARCHDHKYDPFTQRDFYRFRAFFEPYQVRTDQLPGEADLEKDGLPRVFDCHLDAATYRYVRGDETKPIKDEPISPGLPTLVSSVDWQITPVTLSPTAHQPGLRPFVVENLLNAAEKNLSSARTELAKSQKALKASDDDKVEELTLVCDIAEKSLASAESEIASIKARAAADRAKYDEPTDDLQSITHAAAAAERKAGVAKAAFAVAQSELNVLQSTDDAKRKELEKTCATARENLKKAEAALLSKNDEYTPLAGSLKAFESSTEKEPERRKPYPPMSTGRRTALAGLLVDRRNPLTARVAVNHIWLRHFGKPLVPSVFDFGRKGTPPTHPELLDWLAVEFIENGWSMKHLHRLIVTSNAYRMSSVSAGSTTGPSLDVDNVYYWRMNPVRIEAQVVRDALLHLSGELDLTMGGPNIDPAKEQYSRRRSLYFTHSHNEHHRFLAMFDDADVLDCYRRDQSIVPQQALALSNAKQSLEAAVKITAELSELPECATDDGLIRVAFRTIVACEPSDEERSACREALAAWRKLPPVEKGIDPAVRARANLVHALLNHNDFVTAR